MRRDLHWVSRSASVPAGAPARRAGRGLWARATHSQKHLELRRFWTSVPSHSKPGSIQELFIIGSISQRRKTEVHSGLGTSDRPLGYSGSLLSTVPVGPTLLLSQRAFRWDSGGSAETPLLCAHVARSRRRLAPRAQRGREIPVVEIRGCRVVGFPGSFHPHPVCRLGPDHTGNPGRSVTTLTPGKVLHPHRPLTPRPSAQSGSLKLREQQ